LKSVFWKRTVSGHDKRAKKKSFKGVGPATAQCNYTRFNLVQQL